MTIKSELQFAFNNELFGKIKRIIKKNPKQVNFEDDRGFQAIHLFAQKGNIEDVKELLEFKPDINCTTVHGLTPLHLAVKSNNLPMCRFLLENKANPNIADLKKCTPLHTAAFFNYAKIAKLLLSFNADPKIIDDFEETAKSSALSKNNVEVVSVLEAYESASNVNTSDIHGWSLLHTASSLGDVNLIKELLSENADPNLAAKTGSTPLHVAIYNNKPEAVELLLQNGAKIFQYIDDVNSPKVITLTKICLKNPELFEHFDLLHLIKIQANANDHNMLNAEQNDIFNELIKQKEKTTLTESRKKPIEEIDLEDSTTSISHLEQSSVKIAEELSTTEEAISGSDEECYGFYALYNGKISQVTDDFLDKIFGDSSSDSE